jgi:hypothetical protein
MKNPILLIAILTLFILLGCEKEKTDNLIKNKDSKVVSKLDLSDADYLVLKSTDNLKSTNSNQELYKIKIDGDNITGREG